MSNLGLKLIVTPVLIGAASLAGRRWGPAVSGWLVGLPLTSGPVVLFLALGQGPSFAAGAAAGTLAGTTSQTVFCLGYAWLALWARRGWPVALAGGSLAFAVSTLALAHVAIAIVPLCVLVASALLLALRLMPSTMYEASDTRTEARGSAVPAWDLPVRMVVATALVLLLTAAASALGARLTGLLAPFPLYVSILAVFAQRLDGPESAVRVLRGLLFGLFGFAAFFVTLAALIERVGVGPAFAAAVAIDLALQAVSLWALGRSRDVAPARVHG